MSADTPSHTRSTRSKRSRQTTNNDDSMRAPLTKKRRSALQPNTFEPLTEASPNELSDRGVQSNKFNGHTVDPPRLHTRNSSQSRELTLRGGKKAEKRPERGGGLQTLSQNDFYTVAQLPSLPDKIRSSPSIPYSCVVSPENDYVLALGHAEAFIWPYNTSASTPSARDLITFKLPFPPASLGDPLPLAAFTNRSANGEPGIVVISPKLGKIVYWETISNASSSVPGQSSGVSGTVPSMLTGETITELLKAEPAGYVITFSHGRAAHLTIRDQVGRPGIGVQFLRRSTAGSVRSGGIFGSIRNVFVGDRRKGTPIVRAGKAAKAQRDIIIGSEDGELEFWSANVSVGNTLVKTVSLRDSITALVQQQLGLSSTNPSFKVLDLDIATTPANSRVIARRNDTESMPLVLLLAASEQQNTQYFIVEIMIAGGEVNVIETHAVKLPPEVASYSSAWRPRLCIPRVRSIAFVLFETAVMLVSLARIKESPSLQLLTERADPPEQFQDCIQFQEDSIYKVLGFAAEEVDDQASCVFAVQAFGLVRITSHLEAEEEVDLEDIQSRVGPKAKIEQAIFFGTQRQNPLELTKPSDQKFSSQEIETAVLDISHDILSSSSKFLPKSYPSTETQMKRRSKSLSDLIYHVLKFYPSALSRSTRFALLHNAEKLASAQAVWRVQENIQRSYPRKDDREFTYLQFVLRALHESRQKYPDRDKGETDHVRHWLINSVEHINHLMSELDSCLKDLDPMDVKDPRIICDYMIEALDIWIAAHEAGFKFREDNAQAYGLGDEVFKNGVLQTAYPAGLPAPWTSTAETFRFGQRLIYDICSFLNAWWDYKAVPNTNGNAKSKKSKSMPVDLDGKPYDAPSKKALLDLASRLPTEVELFSRITHEETIQAVANAKAAVQDPIEQARKIAGIRGELRPRLVRAIKSICHFNMPGAIKLGEDLEDPGLLVQLNKAFLSKLETEAFLEPEHRVPIEHKIEEVQEHAETYYDKFGNGWAFAHFSDMIQSGQLGSIFAEVQQSAAKKQKHFTWFLEKSVSRGQRVEKLTWINQILGEQDYNAAQKTLETVASQDEKVVWAQKTEFCLAKLAALAANEAVQESTNVRIEAATEQSHGYDDSLALLELQTCIVANIRASCSDAIDEKAARELAFDTFAKIIVAKSPALKRALTTAIDLVLTNQSLPLPAIVDILTLSDPVIFAGPLEEDPNILDHEFSQTLTAIDLAASATVCNAALSPKDLDALRMLTWRRAMIRDDWLVLNDSTGKSDKENMNAMQSSMLFKSILDLFQAGYQTASANSDGRLSNDADLKLRFFGPQDILAAADTLLTPTMLNVYLEILGIQPSSSEAKKFSSELEKDLNRENETLKTFVEKGQLQMHWEGMIREGERSVRAWLGMIGETDEAESEVQDGLETIVESVEDADAVVASN